ncbi:hypothetical protein GCM10028827_24620 [Mucilaginibacter myungsuensis]
MAYGAGSFYIKPLQRVDKWMYQESQERQLVPSSRIENVVQYAPMVLTYGLNLAGVHGKHTFVDRTLILVLAQGFTQGVTSFAKHRTYRERPDGRDNLSFPSGHTSNAFAGAEFMAQELGDVSPWYTVLGYSCATFTAMSRITHRDHWFSDVIAGAGVGIFCTKGAYLLYPYLRNALTKKEKTSDKMGFIPAEIKERPIKNKVLLPTYQSGTFGLAFVAQL